MPLFDLGFVLLALEVELVVARIAAQATTIELHDASGDAAQETAIVGDEQKRRGKSRQELFQPDDRVDVQMVGRLVEQQEIGFSDQGASHHDAALQAAREGFEASDI